MNIHVTPKFPAPLDPEFVPASLFNRDYLKTVKKSGRAIEIKFVLERPNGRRSVFATQILPEDDRTFVYCERLLKALLWLRGGCKVQVAGAKEVAKQLAEVYSATGPRAFDYDFLGRRVYRQELTIDSIEFSEAPEPDELSSGMGRHLDGCRIGFDLGGSDRKCAALIEGEIVHSEEVVWDPYFQADPDYHLHGIQDTLKRAAAHLPRVDAIGGSAAGVYIDNEVRVASLFRGVPEDVFDKRVRTMFLEVQKEWGGIPLVVVNDGEVAALAASMSMGSNSVLGLAFGTSLAAGYVNPVGGITDWLNELAFVPVDYRSDAPADEWSGDNGVGVQYFSQQAVARLCPAAGIPVPDNMPLPERLLEVQSLMKAGDSRALKIYETIGVYFGYAVAHYATFYDLGKVEVMGRVTSGIGGEVILEKAHQVLAAEFPEYSIEVNLPSEKSRRHGQALAAASLPTIG
jgi:predicted NBD/HSP70 family sugar kinase